MKDLIHSVETCSCNSWVFFNLAISVSSPSILVSHTCNLFLSSSSSKLIYSCHSWSYWFSMLVKLLLFDFYKFYIVSLCSHIFEISLSFFSTFASMTFSLCAICFFKSEYKSRTSWCLFFKALCYQRRVLYSSISPSVLEKSSNWEKCFRLDYD